MLIAALASAMSPIAKLDTIKPIKPGAVYLVPTKEDLSQPAVEIKQGNKVYDFKNVTYAGSPDSVEPDQRKGLGIRVIGNNITIKNLKVRGYKVALMAIGCKNLKLIDCDLSYNWKQHLGSTLEKEDLGDWMSYHQNEKDEWLRYGAAAYFKDVNGFEVRNVKAVGGQCGLMMVRSNNGLIWNNNFSFLSGIGLGMYRSSNNRIMHNNIDWCVRGYSHGVYNRGQDSAGILIYEQSNKNTFAYNSVTHGGDGFFLWAGQSTMDNGKGGCNDNLLFGNDFSHAPTNGIEATFSRNKFINNKIDECWHGFWTGYSFDSQIDGNLIMNCEEGIAHEHGQNMTVTSNFFRGNKTDIHLWANPGEDPNWGYPKHRDTKSHTWSIMDNTFASGPTAKALVVAQSNDIKFIGNTDFGSTFSIAKDVTNVSFIKTCVHGDKNKVTLPGDAKDTLWEAPSAEVAVPKWDPMDKDEVYKNVAPEPLKGGKNPMIPAGGRRGRQNILVDEWGPYDFQSPKLWPRSVEADGSVKYEVMGPAGKWSVKSASGLTTSAASGKVPGFVTVKPMKGSTVQQLEISYVGKAFVDYKGVSHKAGESVPLKLERTDIPIDWTVKFFEFDATKEDPRTQFEAYEAKAKSATLTFHKSKLDYTGYGRFEKGVPNNHFGTIAEGSLEIAPGDYLLELTGDDGVRAWLDGKIIVDEWHYQGPTTFSVKRRLGGKHTLKIEHFQLDGYSALQFKIKPGK